MIHSSTEIHAVYLSLLLLQICFPMRVNVLTTRGILRDDVGDLTGWSLDIIYPTLRAKRRRPFLSLFYFLILRKEKCKWVWENVVDLKEPKPDIRTAFRVVVDNNWQGIAYLMLEVAGLDFVEAIQVMTWINKSLQRKIKLLSKKRKLLKVEKKIWGFHGK